MTLRVVKNAMATALLIALSAGAAALPQANGDMAPHDKELEALYWRGHEALKESNWPVALERFRRLEAQLVEKEPKAADAAVYWQAYALVQARRIDEARRTVERLHEKYPESRWNKDAVTLIRQTQPTPPPGSVDALGDDELADTAIMALMSAPEERAIPLLQKVLRGKYSEKVKKRALFVLSQFETSEARTIIANVARDGSPSMRNEAIRMLGISGDSSAIERLSEIYRNAPVEVRREVMQAWLVADRPDLLRDAAKEETDENVRRDAINALGAMGATTELASILDDLPDEESQRAIVHALGVGGDVEQLRRIAESAKSESIRKEALQAIGIAGSDAASKVLIDLYGKSDAPGWHESVLQGLMVAGNTKALRQLYTIAKTREEKQQILKILTASGDDAALDVIEEAINKGENP
ncbi:HEAT repeat domain-containing protein [Tahibacter amnicola]|uniref:HEAT repeat domain-containing protein n=1 Tax=Tahibacter amnicola TaxID=2976241 RepID=A0ABY6BGH6_9GAMM|nr:HEAT repeat domain-containing protein [Tahibacter amnicola]UXI68882.1 HEAT repeat domain-containing protein [Tahibacter amnicola]